MSEELNKSKQSAAELQAALKDVNTAAAEARMSFNDIAAALGKAASKNKEFAEGFKTAQKDVRDLSGEAAKLSKFDKATLETSKGRANVAKQLNILAQKRTKAQATLNANLMKMRNATDEEVIALNKQNILLNDAINNADDLAGSFEIVEDTIEDINSKTTFIDKIAEGLKILPGIGPAIAGPVENLSKGISQFKLGIDESLKGAERTRAQLERASNTLDAFAKGGLAFLIKGIIDADKVQTDFAKTLGISRNEAEQIGQEFNVIAISSGKAFITAEKLLKSQIQLAEATGITAGFTEEQVKSQLILTSKLGLAAEEAAKFTEFSALSGQEVGDINKEILGQVANLEKATGIRIDGREVLKEVSKISGQLSAQFKNDPKLIAQAVIQAKQLGLTLDETANISKKLLDFESSIEAELEAELITGKSLNLERARSLALQGRSAEAAAEIAKQVGTSAEFNNLNVIQQESLARAAGMTADQLADSLRTQELQSKLGDKNIEQLMQTEKGRQRLKTLGGEELFNQLQQQAAADKIADSIDKLQSALANILSGPLGGILDGFASLAQSSFAVYTTIGLITTALAAQLAIKATTLALNISDLAVRRKARRESIKETTSEAIGAGAKIIGAFATNPILAIAGIALAAGTIGFLLAKLTAANDIISKGSNSSGYGNRILMAPEGTFALNNKDTVIAGTDLYRGNDVISGPEGTISMAPPDNTESKKTNMLLEKIINKPSPKVQLDSIEVGTVAGLSAFSIQ